MLAGATPAAQRAHGAPAAGTARLGAALRARASRPSSTSARAAATAGCCWLGIAALIVVSLVLPAVKLVRAEDAAVRQQVRVPGRRRHAGGHAGGADGARCCTNSARYLATVPEVTDYQAYAGTAAPINFNGLVRQYYLRARRRGRATCRSTSSTSTTRSDQSHAIAHARARRRCRRSAGRYGAQRQGRRGAARARRCSRRSSPRSTAPTTPGRIAGRQGECARCSRTRRTSSTSTTAASPTAPQHAAARRPRARRRCSACRSTTSSRRCAPGWPARTSTLAARRQTQVPGCRCACSCRPSSRATSTRCCSSTVRSADGALVPLSRARARCSEPLREQPRLPQGPAAGELRRRRHGRRASTARSTACSPCAAHRRARRRPAAARSPSTSSASPTTPTAATALKWDGEWQITYETFRDMGVAYAVGLMLIYLLVVAQFGSYLTPLIIMAPIPLTIIGVMPGHALLGAQFTATVDDRHDRARRHHRPQLDPAGRLHQPAGARAACRSSEAVVRLRRHRARKPIVLTGLAAMLGALLHPRRPDLQRARDLADLRHPGLHRC